MRIRPRVRKAATSRKPTTVSSPGLARLLIVFGAAGFLLWALVSRSEYILGKSPSGSSNPGSSEKGENGDVEEHSSMPELANDTTRSATEQTTQSFSEGSVPSFGRLKLGEDGNFQVRGAKLKTHALRERIIKENLKHVYLDYYRFGFKGDSAASKQTKVCKGSRCPEFDYCYTGFEKVGVCLKPEIEDPERVPTSYPANCPNLETTCVQDPDFYPHERWASQIFVLHDVYINVAGQVFNSTHFFDSNGCTSEQTFRHLPGKAHVTEYAELVSLVDWFGWNARSNMLDLIPLLVSLDTIMPFLKNIPIAYGLRYGHRRTQLEQMQAIGVEEIIGVELDKWNPQILQSPNLFYAKTLFLPLHQRCGRPSRTLWKHIRTNHFLAKGGLPLYKPDWSPRTVNPGGKPLTSADDWVVLLGMKKEKAPLVDVLNLESHMQEMFPKGKVQIYYEGAMPMPRRKELLNRARLLVAVHENVLADMVYMPPGGSILEIRPRDDQDPTFHHLAEVCGLEYHLVFCEGHRADLKHPSTLRVKDPKPLIKALQHIAKKITGS